MSRRGGRGIQQKHKQGKPRRKRRRVVRIEYSEETVKEIFLPFLSHFCFLFAFLSLLFAVRPYPITISDWPFGGGGP